MVSGLRMPELRYIDRESVNVFAVSGRDGGTIFVTAGMLESMNRDELRAVVAHEMARIDLSYSFAVDLRATLEAIAVMLDLTLGSLLGLAVSALGILLVVLVFFSLLPYWLLNVSDSGAAVAIYFLVLIPMLLVLYRAMNIGIINYNNGFFLADELAARWTMHPEALINALRKAEPTHRNKSLDFAQRLSFVPYVPRKRRDNAGVKTPMIVSARSETNLPMIREPAFSKPLFPSVQSRIENLIKGIGHPF